MILLHNKHEIALLLHMKLHCTANLSQLKNREIQRPVWFATNSESNNNNNNNKIRLL
jgi:hypothetical protein